jgi:hypothetical protein
MQQFAPTTGAPHLDFKDSHRPVQLTPYSGDGRQERIGRELRMDRLPSSTPAQLDRRVGPWIDGTVSICKLAGAKRCIFEKQDSPIMLLQKSYRGYADDALQAAS